MVSQAAKTALRMAYRDISPEVESALIMRLYGMGKSLREIAEVARLTQSQVRLRIGRQVNNLRWRYGSKLPALAKRTSDEDERSDDELDRALVRWLHEDVPVVREAASLAGRHFRKENPVLREMRKEFGKEFFDGE